MHLHQAKAGDRCARRAAYSSTLHLLQSAALRLNHHLLIKSRLFWFAELQSPLSAYICTVQKLASSRFYTVQGLETYSGESRLSPILDYEKLNPSQMMAEFPSNFMRSHRKRRWLQAQKDVTKRDHWVLLIKPLQERSAWTSVGTDH